MRDPVRVVVGYQGQANPDIEQKVVVLKDAQMKWDWLVSELESCLGDGKILVFTGSRADTEDLRLKLGSHFQKRQLLVHLDCIHGDR